MGSLAASPPPEIRARLRGVHPIGMLECGRIFYTAIFRMSLQFALTRIGRRQIANPRYMAVRSNEIGRLFVWPRCSPGPLKGPTIQWDQVGTDGDQNQRSFRLAESRRRARACLM